MYIAIVYYQACREVGPYQNHVADNRLNSRAGVFALSLATWHGMRIVSCPPRFAILN